MLEPMLLCGLLDLGEPALLRERKFNFEEFGCEELLDVSHVWTIACDCVDFTGIEDVKEAVA